ncbi:hypothetical protein PpBr36_03740 [Pyricularia pennisetigena]|uniref:hypothetical protein n=1 Tax=Pyricularia pennisetigena TaxID=1578925 RepID=UPI00114DC110|nr:hypothetical protein PpBr36_03740 [Pyricularia pennisetigena]TLS31075.1 hypothetical protein PpBr36_03740 [Pyricularia pennisetigena]
MSDTNAHLSAAELHALFDILTHYETYSEFVDLRYPDTPANIGYPFAKRIKDGSLVHATKPAAPIIQQLLATFVTEIFALRSLPNSFWSVQLQGIFENLAAANLSESYDKGTLGTRKTLCTVFSSILELVARGQLGGVQRNVENTRSLRSNVYNLDSAQSLIKAWDDVVQELVYGNLIDELFDHAAKVSGNLEEHSAAAEAAAHYIVMHLATVLHQVFVVSSEGPYILKLLDSMYKMLPWVMIKQTLRIGNAATMLNGLVKLLLSKLSIGSVSNWIGVTTDADDGMNLLQRIISLTLSWDCSDFKKTIDHVKKSKNGPTKEQLAAIDEHVRLSRDEQDKLRGMSISEGKSIIIAILQSQHQNCSISDAEHSALLDYYSARLSIRDREEISRVLCRSRPDLMTQLFRDLMGAYEPVIREVHSRVPLHETIGDIEAFLGEMIETAKGTKSQVATITDFVDLLMRNRSRLYRWLHLLGKECPGPREEFRTWAHNSIREFRRNSASPSSSPAKGYTYGDINTGHGHESYCRGAAGDMSAPLSAMFAALPRETRADVRHQIDAHASYLEIINGRSVVHMQNILDCMSARRSNSSLGVHDVTGKLRSKISSKTSSGTSSPAPARLGSPDNGAEAWDASGPGVYLVRWNDLLDETLVTPATPYGPPRLGKDVKQKTSMGKAGTGAKAKDKKLPKGFVEEFEGLKVDGGAVSDIEAPEVGAVLTALGKEFWQLLAGRHAAAQSNAAPVTNFI